MADITVIKRDGEFEDFDVKKIADSIMSAAIEVGGEDFTVAGNLADEVLDILETNEVEQIYANDLHNLVEKTLIENGHAQTAKAYILKGADRNRMREMDTELMRSFEEITFTDPSESEIKRENANIDSSTAMGTMLKYGSEAAKRFNLLYLMSNDIAEAHKNGDIHIHDLDFLSLTETCVTSDSYVTVKINNEIRVVTVEELMDMLGHTKSEPDKWYDVSSDVKILSNNEFVTLNKIVKHKSNNKRVLSIKTHTGELKVTDDHRVSVLNGSDIVDVKASDLKVGDILHINSIDKDRYNRKFIDITEVYTGDNLVIANTNEVIQNIKVNNNWKPFCEIFDYRDGRALQIRSGKANMTIAEYKSIEHLTTFTHSELRLKYKRSRGDETINAIVPLTFELGNVIGLMYSEGSLGEYTDKRQESPVKQACFCNYDEDLIDQFNRNYATVFNNAVLKRREHKGKHTGTVLSGYLQYELFQGVFGVKESTQDIRLADWMYEANSEFVSGLMAGIIDGDGTVQKDGYRVMIGSISIGLLTDIQKLLLLRGIKSTIKERSGAEAGTVAHFVNDGEDVYSVRSYNNYVIEFTGDLSNKLEWINSNKINAVDLKSSDKFMHKLVSITSIDEIEYDGYVYDMETENHHFTVNGFNVHNCCQIPLDKLFKGGFNTGHGFLREPGNIRTAGALAAIAIQSNQNDQHGGQSVPMFDYYLAPYVALSYAKTIAHVAKNKLDLSNERYKELKAILVDYQKKNTLIMDEAHVEEIKGILRDFFNNYNIRCSDKRINRIMEDAYDDTYDETFQSMEAFVHNLNTMHCLPASEKIWVLDVKTGDFKSITMEELDSEFEEKRFKVISLNKKTGKSEFKFITHCKKLDNNRNLVKITDNQGRTVTVTDNHRIMTIDGINITEDIPENCEYTLSPRGITFPAVKYDLCVSDYGKPRKDNPFQNDHILLNEKFAEFIGYYMADGCILGETSTCCISACGKVTFDYMEKLIEDVFGVQLKTSYTYYKNSKSGEVEEKDIRIQLGMPLAKMIKHKFGRTGHEKKIPVELMFASESVRKAFLKAYFKLDGRKDRNYAEISTVNKELQAQVAFMLSSLGVSSHYTTRSCTNGFDSTKERDDLHFITLSGHDAYEVGIKDEDNTAFEIPKYYLGNVYEAYEGICDDITSKRGSKNLRYSELSELIDEHDASDVKHLMNVYANNIVMKDNINSGDEYVYDISVEDNENFLTYECIFVHNSRAGAQVPFSSINYGTDTSVEGRMVMETILKTTDQGLGNGETPIFPIQIFKMKTGVNFNPEDPNYDLFKLACRVSAKRLYPNFSNLDAPYNAAVYKEGHPETEVAYMGCRTRVATNIYDPNKAIVPGRGNLSFTSINLPRLAIEANGNVDVFFESLGRMMELVHKQLLERFELQCKKHPRNYPFLMGQGVWLDSEKLGPDDDIRAVLKHGTLTVGFIGLAETLVALIGKHHGESEEALQLGLKIIARMREYTDAWSKEEHMNYSVIGTPAEGLSGRFVRMDKEKYGSIPGVTDRDYYTNSTHVPVYYEISATKKIEIEAQFLPYLNGGHITYIEMDGDPTKNLKAFEKIVRYMHDKDIGYGAVNHPKDRDPVCGYLGIIGDVCPRCGRREGEPMSIEMYNRIKGYANVGNAETLGYHAGSREEEKDRKPLSI